MKSFLKLVCLASYVISSSFCSQTMAQERLRTAMGWEAALSDQQAWQQLAVPISGQVQPLPEWIRLLSAKMPKAAAAFIELDFAHRQLGPVDLRLRNALRFTSASLNGCDYNKTIAIADAMRAGENDERLKALEDGSLQGWSDSEQQAIEFAKAMTIDSANYPDGKFEKLVASFSEEEAAAMVLHLAYYNFHDRLMIVLGVIDGSQDANLVAADVKFEHVFPSSDSKKSASRTPEKEITTSSNINKNVVTHASPHTWLEYDDLQVKLQQQRERTPRLVPPDWAEIAQRLPPGLMDNPSDIVWYQLSFGYAAELAIPFEIYLREAGSEVVRNWDSLFGGSLFWLVTDAMKCPYCMGHCEMNWEVAGLSQDQIADRSRALSGNDWSNFTEGEQVALDFARKLTIAPQQIIPEDLNSLRKAFGEERAFYIALNTSRYNYMTRISNGFQLPLERDNVFWNYYGLPKPTR